MKKKKIKKQRKEIKELKKFVWTLMDQINELEAEIAAKKKGV